MEISVVRGIVLRETKTRESDKILTLLTEDGKLPVIAQRARQKRCPYGAAAQPLVYAEWTLRHRGAWYYAKEGSTLEMFSGLQQSLEALALGFYFAELSEAVTTEEEPAEPLLRHLLNGLYALSTLQKPLRLAKAAFELRLLCLIGYEPLAGGCAVCGRTDPTEPVLDVEQGVLRCQSCGHTRAVPLTPAAVAALRHIVYGDPKRLYAFRLKGASLECLSQAAEQFLLAQLDRRFRTLDFYKGLDSSVSL